MFGHASRRELDGVGAASVDETRRRLWPGAHRDVLAAAVRAAEVADLDGDADFNDERITTGPNTGVAIGSVPLGGMGTLGAIFGGGGGTGQICLNISDASIECERIRETRQVGRVSWREIIRN